MDLKSYEAVNRGREQNEVRKKSTWFSSKGVEGNS